MKTTFSISVKKPCSERFENFKKTENGGFCVTCTKEVIDFSMMSDSELIAHFSTREQKRCGRFRTDQLKTYSNKMNVSRQPNLFSKSLGVLSFSLLSLCAVSSGIAQEIAEAPLVSQIKIGHFESQIENTVQQDGKYMVKGTVVDEDNLPLPGANVVLKGTKEGTVTDFDGTFEFPTALEAGQTLLFSYLGYERKEYLVVDSATEVIDITIVFDYADVELMGEVVVGRAYVSKRNIFQKFIDLFR